MTSINKKKNTQRERDTRTKRGVIEELVGVRINADDDEIVAAVLADPSGKVRINRQGPTLVH